MARLIDSVDETIKRYAEHGDILQFISDVRFAVINAPTVDAVEVVHGRWEYWAGGLEKCSVCGYEYTDYLECHNYCGNYGAKMERG